MDDGDSIKARARRASHTFTHRIEVRNHQLLADEPSAKGGEDQGPTPQELLAASLASCTAITVEMYAERKGWEVGQLEVECEYAPAERGAATHFKLVLRLPNDCTEEQLERLRVIAAKCPIHRILDGEATFEERIERAAPARA